MHKYNTYIITGGSCIRQNITEHKINITNNFALRKGELVWKKFQIQLKNVRKMLNTHNV